MKLVVFGASRGVGRHVVEQALARGWEVTAASRRPAESGARFVACDVTDAKAVGRAMEGQDVVICALGTDTNKGPITLYSTGARNIVASMKAHGLRRLVFLSNFGVLNERGKGFRQRLLLALIKRMLRPTLDDHRAALDILRASGLDWTAVRAMPLTNTALTAIYRVEAAGLPTRGASISRADVAHFMLEEAANGAFNQETPSIAY